MLSSRQIGLSIVLTSLIAIGGCGKESPAPPPPKAEPGPTTTQSAPSTGVNGQAAPDLANKSGCFACHAVDKKVVGPAYRDVAAKYRGQPDAELKLIQKVKNGGRGIWGQVPMPPNLQVKDEDIKTLVDWILSLK